MVRGVTFCAPQTQSTAQGRHWSFPGLGSFRCANRLAKRIFAKWRIFSWCHCQKISKTLHVSAPSLPRHNSSTDLPSELPAELLSAPLVWVRCGDLVPPLQLLYDGPYAVLGRGPCSFTIRVGLRDEVVAVSHLKACTAADATPGSLRHRSRPPDSHPGGPAATKRVSFSYPLDLHLLFKRRHETVPELFSYPARRFLHAWDRRCHHKCHRRGTRPINGHRYRGWTSDLFSSQARPLTQSSLGTVYWAYLLCSWT